jgi:ubiquinone/menaquinone biosynthesis C-methylase UbiE
MLERVPLADHPSRRAPSRPAVSDDGPLVDYGRAASVYDRGRALATDSLARWRRAVAARLPDGGVDRVIDVGAGTGLFLDMWRGVGAGTVVAVEPSAEMRARAVAHSGAGVHVVAGAASHLPVASGSADVLWLSAVVHHLADLDAAAVEMRRVLRDGGRVFVRGFLPDRSTVPWLPSFPGWERAAARFPTTARLAAAFGSAGCAVVDVVEVAEPDRHSGDDAADWVLAMRHADSLLTGLADDEITAGVRALRAVGGDLLPAVELTLLVLDC